MINAIGTRFYTQAYTIPEDAAGAAVKTFTKNSMVAFYRTNDRGGVFYVNLGGAQNTLLEQVTGGAVLKTGLTFSFIPSGTVLRASDNTSGGSWSGIIVTIELE